MYARALAGRVEPHDGLRGRRENWRMPPLALLERPKWSRGRHATLYAMYGYLVVAVAMLLVKAIQLGLHTGPHH
jgi:hypothetical protein